MFLLVTGQMTKAGNESGCRERICQDIGRVREEGDESGTDVGWMTSELMSC